MHEIRQLRSCCRSITLSIVSIDPQTISCPRQDTDAVLLYLANSTIIKSPWAISSSQARQPDFPSSLESSNFVSASQAASNTLRCPGRYLRNRSPSETLPTHRSRSAHIDIDCPRRPSQISSATLGLPRRRGIEQANRLRDCPRLYRFCDICLSSRKFRRCCSPDRLIASNLVCDCIAPHPVPIQTAVLSTGETALLHLSINYYTP